MTIEFAQSSHDAIDNAFAGKLAAINKAVKQPGHPFSWRNKPSIFVSDKRFTYGSTAPLNPTPSQSISTRNMTSSINTETRSASDSTARIQGKPNSARSQ